MVLLDMKRILIATIGLLATSTLADSWQAKPTPTPTDSHKPLILISIDGPFAVDCQQIPYIYLKLECQQYPGGEPSVGLNFLTFNADDGWVSIHEARGTEITTFRLDENTLSIIYSPAGSKETWGFQLNLKDPAKTTGFWLIQTTGVKLTITPMQTALVPLKMFTWPGNLETYHSK
jgi:hypothetical protein